MKFAKLFLFLAVVLSLGSFTASAQTTSNPQIFTVTFPGQTTSGIAPASAVAGSPAFTLTINGANFQQGDAAQWCSVTPAPCTTPTPLQTTFVSASQLTASVGAAQIASSGTFNVTVSRTTSHAVNMNIAPSPTSGVSSYNVYRAPTVNGPFAKLASIFPAGSFSDRSVIAGGIYFYRATAVSPAGESSPSNQVSATVPNS